MTSYTRQAGPRKSRAGIRIPSVSKVQFHRTGLRRGDRLVITPIAISSGGSPTASQRESVLTKGKLCEYGLDFFFLLELTAYPASNQSHFFQS